MRGGSLFCIFFLAAIFASVTLAATTPSRTCDDPAHSSQPFCNPSLPLSERVANLISLLTTEEKLTQFTNDAPGIPRLSIGAFEWWNEALHGVAYSPGVNFDGKIECATSFPQVINTAATFNKTLMHLIGQVVSTEARAMHNEQQAGLTYWTPNINIFRDPRWGRGQETPGEDPHLSAMYSLLYVRGLQEGEDEKYLKISACCKHFFAYSLEDADGVDRHHFDAITTKQDIVDTYLPAFEACVREGRASAMMCSYNEVNGVPSCANFPLLTDLARRAWGFDGYITGDCGAVDDVMYTHNYTNNTDLTCFDTLSAGMDVDCGKFLNLHLPAAYSDGSVNSTLVDEALTHLFSVRFRLGEFDPLNVQKYSKYGPDHVATHAHHNVALEAAQQSIVLLFNRDSSFLPLTSSSSSFGLVGPHFNATDVMQGNYQGKACFLVSPEEAFQRFSQNISVAAGCSSVACPDQSGFNEAVEVAKSSDVTVVFVGLDQSEESEGKDRLNLFLPGEQATLIQEVVQNAKGDVVLVIFSGSAVDLESDVLDDLSDGEKAKIGAILWAGYGGEFGGLAIAQTIFGEVNPSGRLPVTWYRNSYTSQVEMTQMNMRADIASSYPGRTYRFFTGAPIYPFGFGLSYTSFEYKTDRRVIHLDKSQVASVAASTNEKSLTFRGHSSDAKVADVVVHVTNQGQRAGSDSVLVFMRPPHPGHAGSPLLQLLGFEKIFLQPGETGTVTIPVFASDFALVDENGLRSIENSIGNWEIVAANELLHTVVVA